LLGRPTLKKGFLPGTEIRDGCVVPTVGGGLCMLSGALFRLAAEMDWVIQERHGHTIAPSDLGRIDATVFWPFVDLRFAPRAGAAVLRVRVAGGHLRVAVYGEPQDVRPKLRVWRQARAAQSDLQTSRILRSGHSATRVEVLGRDSQRVLAQGLRRNCLTCEERNCHARESVLEAL
jgi:vancomycin resistance protein VanW